MPEAEAAPEGCGGRGLAVPVGRAWGAEVLEGEEAGEEAGGAWLELPLGAAEPVGRETGEPVVEAG